MFDRMLSLVVALGLALLIWLYARGCDRVYELPEVPVYFLCPANFSLRPKFFDESEGRIHLRVRGPAGDQPPKINAFVDLIQGNCLAPGSYHEPVQIQLPKDFTLMSGAPRSVSFQLVPLDSTLAAP